MTRISVALDWQVKHARRAEEPGATNKKSLLVWMLPMKSLHLLKSHPILKKTRSHESERLNVTARSSTKPETTTELRRAARIGSPDEKHQLQN
jgi:hypothetical protein